MTILQIEHATGDYDRWKQAFDSDPVGREQGGVRRYRIMQRADDPNYVVVDLEFESRDQAEAFQTALRGLWSRVGSELGLERPQGRILEEAESKQY